MYLPLCDPMNCSTQASLSFTISLSLLKLMSIESVMPSNHLMLCCPRLICPQSLPAFRVFSTESALCIRWQSIGASASVVPVSVQDFFLTFLFFFSLSFYYYYYYFTLQYCIGFAIHQHASSMGVHADFSLELTGLISLLSEGCWKVFSKTTVQKHKFFSAQPSLWSYSHIHIWLLGKKQKQKQKHSIDYMDLWWKCDVSAF